MEVAILYSQRNLAKALKINPQGILHVGAHLAEEVKTYEKIMATNFGKMIWVESQSEKCETLRRTLDLDRNVVIEATIWDKSNVIMTFYETSNSESSSLLNLGLHSEIYPEISVIHERQVETRRLDDLQQINEIPFDFINLDLQGVELKALRSLGRHLEKCQWIYVEVNKIELYEDCTIIHELDTFLCQNGFKRVSTRWIWGAGWGDAIYFREAHITLRVQFAAVFLRLEWLSLHCSGWIRSKTPSKFKKRLKRMLS